MDIRSMLFASSAALCLAACVTQPSQPSSATAASTPATKPAPAPSMVYVTGSRLGVPSSSRSSAQGAQPVQSIGSQEIQQSGQTDAASAVNMLSTQTVSSGGMNSGSH